MEKKHRKKSSESKKPDYKFFTGLGLIIFLVLINSFVKDIPWFIVAVPALLMGIDLTSVIEYMKSRK